MKGFDFDLTLVHDGENVRVTGHISASYPAVMHLANGDPGYPAEGGEIEDYKIYAEDGSEIEDADGDIIDDLMDDIMEAASEAVYSDKADAAEAAAEMRRDLEADK